jgi:hypothetical protein
VVEAITIPVGGAATEKAAETVSWYRRDPAGAERGAPVIASLHSPGVEAQFRNGLHATGQQGPLGPLRVVAPATVLAWLTRDVLPRISLEQIRSPDREALLSVLDLGAALEGDGSGVPDGRGAFRGGANRNRLLLMTAGVRAVSSDSDEPPFAVAGCHSTGLIRLHARGDPNEFEAYESLESLDRALPSRRILVDELHGHWLGETVDPRVPGEEALLCDQIGSGTEELVAAIDQCPPRVCVTCAGYTGVGALGTHQQLLMVNGTVREQLVADPATFRRLLFSGVWATYPQEPVLSGGTFFRAGHFGYDNSMCLPPFVPYGRGEDVAWGALLKWILPPGSLVHIPYGVRHRRESDRRRSGDDLTRPGLRIADIVASLLSTLPPREVGEVDGDDRMRVAGEVLLRWSEQPASRIAQFIDGLITAIARLTAERFSQLFDQWQGEPECGRRWCAPSLIGKPGLSTAPAERGIRDATGARIDPGLVAALVGVYGRALTVWPEVHRVCAATPLADRRFDVT